MNEEFEHHPEVAFLGRHPRAPRGSGSHIFARTRFINYGRLPMPSSGSKLIFTETARTAGVDDDKDEFFPFIDTIDLAKQILGLA